MQAQKSSYGATLHGNDSSDYTLGCFVKDDCDDIATDDDSLYNSLERCSVPTTSQGAKAIADGLRANTSLKSLQ